MKASPERPGAYSLTLHGPGYASECVAAPIARESKLDARLRFDCEAGRFCAYGTDQAARAEGNV